MNPSQLYSRHLFLTKPIQIPHFSNMQSNKPLDQVLRPRGNHDQNYRKVSVLGNFFSVNLKNITNLYIASIKFEPPILRDNRKLKNQVLDQAMSQIKSIIPEPTICGMNILTSSEPKEKSFEINTKQHKITIKQVRVLQCKNEPRNLLFFLNNRLRNTLSQAGFSEIGRTGKYFNIKRRKEIDNLNMYSGYRANFVLLERGIFLRVDNAKKIVRNQTVLEYIKDLYKMNEGKDREDKRNIVRNALQNLIIQVNYGNGRYHKIQELVYRDITEEMFDKFNILQYYKQKYNIEIRDIKQPLLKVQNKREKDREILLVPELCLMTGIPDDFDEFKRKKISESTILDPQTKRKQILQIVQDLEKGSDDFQSLQDVGISLSNKLYNFDAKSIPVPRISLGEDQRVQQGKEAFFQLFGQPIYASKHSVKCAILYFRADLKDMLRTLESTSKNLKVDFSFDQYQIRDERYAVDEIKKTIQKIKDQKKHNICLIVIPPNLKSQYKRIKQVALVENDMVCQVVVEASLRKKNAQSIVTKVLLQMIAKRGNTLWVPTSKTKFSEIMLIGIDSAAMGNTNMLTACGTVNSTFTSIITKRTEFKNLEDKFQCIHKLVMDILNYSVERNGVPPKDVIVFMNSCSFDQVKLLNEFFVKAFLTQIQLVFKEKAPMIQVVLVNTKTSERFFTDHGENVKAGTLINTDVVSKEYDFFMVSQNSNKGSVVPNHFKVVFTNSKMEEGVLAELIFNQCFNYSNWSGSIKIPGILQYAKKSAKFGAEVLESNKMSESLEKCLYFI